MCFPVYHNLTMPLRFTVSDIKRKNNSFSKKIKGLFEYKGLCSMGFIIKGKTGSFSYLEDADKIAEKSKDSGEDQMKESDKKR